MFRRLIKTDAAGGASLYPASVPTTPAGGWEHFC
jgi:hypothetical protein